MLRRRAWHWTVAASAAVIVAVSDLVLVHVARTAAGVSDLFGTHVDLDLHTSAERLAALGALLLVGTLIALLVLARLDPRTRRGAGRGRPCRTAPVRPQRRASP